MDQPTLKFPTDREEVTRTELADICGVTEQTIRRWELLFGLPCIKQGKRRIYNIDTFKRWRANGAVAA